ncbi:MAG: hypothetical protein IJE89_04845 [Bacilli bacterium]|nr:hypothetical protein [Bacilli bacterium]
MNKKKIIIIISISIIVIIILITLIIFNTIKNKNLTKENMEIITTNYEELSINVNEYNNVRTKLSEKLNNFIYEKYKNNHEEYLSILLEYNNIIKKIDNNVDNINDKCNFIYKNISVNKICNSYQMIYEKLINLYISDINIYNNKITSYNEYKSESINLFELIHTDYIDYNNDNIYEGIDTNEVN